MLNCLHKITTFFTPRTIYKIKSKINSEIKVIQFLGKRSIQVGSLQQSGDLVEKIWQKGIREIEKLSLPAGKAGNKEIKEILILGLGGGSVVNIVNKYLPRAKMTTIEIDPIMVGIGKRFFSLNNFPNLKIRVEDAFFYLGKNKTKYDLILVDLYIGSQISNKIKSVRFIKDVKRSLKKGGLVLFNHIRNKKQIKELSLFQQLLAREFKLVKIVKPLINSLFICQY